VGHLPDLACSQFAVFVGAATFVSVGAVGAGEFVLQRCAWLPDRWPFGVRGVGPRASRVSYAS